MKRYLKMCVILAAVFIAVSGCSGKKLPISLEEAGNMTEEQVKQELAGFSRKEIEVEDVQTFEGIIEEVHGSSAVIAVDEGFPICSSGSMVSVTLDENMSMAQVGNRVRVSYSGAVMETYPLQLEKQKSIELLAGETYDQIPMAMIDGCLYRSAGEISDIEGRCGVMDGKIDSSVDGAEIPTENGQSNFGAGYGYQRVDGDHIDINMPFGDPDSLQWVRFEKVEASEKAKENQINEADTDVFPGVTMRLLEVTQTGIKVEMLNTTDLEVEFGEDYDLQEFAGGEWVSVPYLIDNWAFNSIAYIMPKNTPVDWETDWKIFHGVLKPGRYRLVKSVVDFRGTGDYTKYRLALEFEI